MYKWQPLHLIDSFSSFYSMRSYNLQSLRLLRLTCYYQRFLMRCNKVRVLKGDDRLSSNKEYGKVYWNDFYRKIYKKWKSFIQRIPRKKNRFFVALTSKSIFLARNVSTLVAVVGKLPSRRRQDLGLWFVYFQELILLSFQFLPVFISTEKQRKNTT